MRQTILLYLFLMGLVLFGQEADLNYMPDVLPTSPNAFSFGKYGQVPVGLFTGTPQIDIPLYEINYNGIFIPISVNYSSNGIRVDEMPSNVGIGWSLIAGGIVMRSLFDEPDEDGRAILPDVNFESDEMQNFLFTVTTQLGYDTQPDIFSFNFQGYSGKFFLNDDMEPQMINPSPLKIERLPGFGGTSLQGYDIKFTTPDGIIYWFGGDEATERTTTESYGNVPGGAPHINGPIETAWLLKKITLINGKEIEFIYENNLQVFDGGISQQIQASVYSQSDINNGNPIVNLGYHQLPVITRNRINASKLTRINWDGGSVVFNYNSMYLDNWNGFEKLIDLTVLNTENQIVKKMEFDYFEESCDLTFQNPDNNGQYHIPNQKRVFLEKITDVTGGNNNPHQFEYYFPDQLPPRLSYAQDYWGYFNGKDNPDMVPNDLSLYNPNSYEDPNIDLRLINIMFHNVGGDKNADGLYGVKGLLKKVTYPIKGNTELFYESNSYLKNEFQYPQATDFHLQIDTGEDDFGWTFDANTTVAIPFLQEHVPIYFSVIRVNNCGETNPPPQWTKDMTLTIKNTTDGSDVPIETYSAYHGYISVPTPLHITDSNTESYFITLEEGIEYMIQIGVNKPCLSANFNMSYYSQNGHFELVNKEIGGMRISKIVSRSIDSPEIVKKYYYGNLECLECSSGELETFKPAISFHTTDKIWTELVGGVPVVIERIQTNMYLGSSSLNPLYNTQGYHIAYKNVVESFGNNFEGGATLHNYNIVFDALPALPIAGDPIVGTNYSNEFGNGNELSSTTYKINQNSFVKVEEIFNSYLIDDRKFYITNGFTASERRFFDNPAGIHHDYNLNTYLISSKWNYLKGTTIKKYDIEGQNPIELNTEYIFDNPNHLQLSRIVKNSSDLDVLLTKNYYPHDIQSDPVLDLMIQRNQIGSPILQENFVNNNLMSSLKKKYKVWENGIILPELIQSSTKSDPFETITNFFHYDENGHILESSKKSEEHISYLWGYDKQYPTAVILNSTIDESGFSNFENDEPGSFDPPPTGSWSFNTILSDVKTGKSSASVAISSGPSHYFDVGENAANHNGYKASVWVKGYESSYLHIQVNDNYSLSKRVTNTGGSTSVWRLIEVELPKEIYKDNINSTMRIKVYVGSPSGTSYFDDLRFCPMDAEMTTYTYEPLIGVTSESDAGNIPIVYEYDGFGRLKLIRDHDGNILKRFDYNYAHEN